MPRPAQTPTRTVLLDRLRAIAGARHVLTGPAQTLRYRRGFRFGNGPALAVVSPGSLLEQWRVLQACVEADVIVIMQAANTGLTGGSSPDGDRYDRDVVIISTLRLRTVHLLGADARQVLCLPGATLDALEHKLRPHGREPHSVIGSSCIGASVIGGVSNNSGGALVRRGPVYTEMALFAQRDAGGTLRLVNHLGIALGDTAEDILARLDAGTFTEADIDWNAGRGHDDSYAHHVRDIDAPTPARFNADPSRLHEASGCAGRLAVFAVRLDSFPADPSPAVFYIGTNDTSVLTDIRRAILGTFSALPIAGEYMHRDAFDIAERYGKDTFLVIRHLGTARMPRLFALKSRIDAWARKLPFVPDNLADRLLQGISALFPAHLPPRLMEWRDRFEHHLMLKVPRELIGETRDFLDPYFAGHSERGAFFACTPEEGTAAFLHRFAAAGAAIRYRAVHPRDAEDIVALDIALRRDDRDWFEHLPPAIDAAVSHKLYYGHFLCHVMHQDYVVRRGHDCVALEHEMLALLDARGACYPAEHNVGHLYKAPDAMAAHYRSLDPCNCFNPGIGLTTRRRDWVAESV
ncbi:D-lactate dehydrogenase [Ameyamaea chiangmaiensis]|uniref:Quinone-dependent D-lactate dehydrogenase n=1 Tax=Ameyamaea chiangmaiensis TaxID=442969 RepID=A0A850PBA1_9PROT|nr:D-lactate dehydrogenase [Ameyamaea chiangmaiensis]MBS4075885.1 D-lactate dehydrogenase [Ameyamaea chiangmaiensis]NVN41228.1 D-lactate dehydrogenase [Ameyamaea chiangmaiensis]